MAWLQEVQQGRLWASGICLLQVLCVMFEIWHLLVWVSLGIVPEASFKGFSWKGLPGRPWREVEKVKQKGRREQKVQ